MSRRLKPLVLFFVLLCAWEAGARALRLPSFVLPPPSAVVVFIATYPASLAFHTAATIEEVLLGFLLSLAVGVSLGTA